MHGRGTFIYAANSQVGTGGGTISRSTILMTSVQLTAVKRIRKLDLKKLATNPSCNYEYIAKRGLVRKDPETKGSDNEESDDD